MEQSRDVGFRLLQEMSADIQNRMAEVWALREAVRTAEGNAAQPRADSLAVVAPPPCNELRA
jgi:hypothetical protein